MIKKIKPALFLHIQKTAGTSVQEMAREAYGNENVVSHGDFQTLGQEGCRKVPFLSGHFGFAFAQPLMEGRYCFVFLRNPVERLISLYHFCKTRPPEQHPIYALAHREDLCGFLDDRHGELHRSCIWNNQAWQLTRGRGEEMVGLTPEGGWDRPAQVILDEARRNLERFDHVGFVETFNEDVQSIFVDLGSPGVATRKSNSVPCKSIYADLPRRTKARLREVTRLDRALYVHAVRTYAGDRLTLRLRDRLLSGVTKWSNGRLG